MSPTRPTLLPEIERQLSELTLAPGRPLIISDADEVLVHFMEAMEDYLDRQGLWINLNNFAISGNIRSKETDEVVEVPNLLDDFFADRTRSMRAVDHASASLHSLAERAQIVILTNLPEAYKQDRIDNLLDHGMEYPVVIGSGLKGPAVAWLEDRISAPVFFLDDIPHNINSVDQSCRQAHKIHFVADQRLAKRIDAASGASTRIDCWKQAHDWITARLDEAGH